VDETEMRRRVAGARVARLATVRPDGTPHVLPIVFALQGDTLYTAVDEKPKRTPRLQRLRNLAANPAVEVLVDHYEEDWDALWWVRLGGMARVLVDGPEHDLGARLLEEKYPQEHGWRLESMVIIDVRRWAGWSPG
jgi:PPOX class probable F420-dependent enzyme